MRVLLLALAVAWLAAAAMAQDRAGPGRVTAWDALATYADAQVANPDTPTQLLETLRERLVDMRGEALEVENALAPGVADLEARLDALGPPPGEGAAEAPEIAERRQSLNDQLAAARAPVIEAQEAYRRAGALVDEIDRIVRARFSAQILSHAPSPLLPGTWLAAVGEVRDGVRDLSGRIRGGWSDLDQRALLLRRVPNLFLAVLGVAIALSLRARLGEWIERRLEVATEPRTVAWIVALRNLNRLIVPAVGFGLLFGALDPRGFVGRAGAGDLFRLPAFALVLIGAGWLAGSLFAPRHAAHRIAPVDGEGAIAGARLVHYLGGVFALALLARDLFVAGDFSPAARSAFGFPVVLLGALGLWRAAGLIRLMHDRLLGDDDGGRDTTAAAIGLQALRLLARILRLLAVAAALLAAAGYLTAAVYLVFPSIMTLGLIGAGLVLFDLLTKTAVSLLAVPAAGREAPDPGLLPVIIGVLVFLGLLPVLALIWGARPADLGDVWTLLREGATVGGIRISARVIVTLLLVFGIGMTVTRLLQALMRGSVLPRTKLDPGGRNAIVAGIGYVGFFLAGLAAVTAAGLDLTSLAFVAGALSVGIGFGLQNIVSNFVSGIILLVERPIKEGDWIEVGNHVGYVRGIRVRSTEIETFDRSSVILPNSDLIAGTVLNRTHRAMSGRLQVPVSVTYDTDPAEVERLLTEIAAAHPLVLEDPGPRVLFMNLGPDTMDFEIRCWLRDVNYSLSVRSDLNFEIVGRFRAAGIRTRPFGRDLPPEAPPEPPAVGLQRGRKEKEA